MTEKKHLTMDGRGVRPSTPKPMPTFLDKRGAGQHPETPKPTPQPTDKPSNSSGKPNP